MANVKTGWLKDNLGDKFAPKTLLSQVVTSDGTLLEDDITEIKTNIENVSQLVGDTSVSEQITDAVSQKSQVQMITGETAEILPTLKIHKLTQDEYDQKFADGVLDENALYLTPDEEMDMSPYATVEELNTKADANHIHEDINASVANLNTLVGDTRVSDQIAEAIAKRSQVQIITWEADD